MVSLRKCMFCSIYLVLGVVFNFCYVISRLSLLLVGEHGLHVFFDLSCIGCGGMTSSCWKCSCGLLLDCIVVCEVYVVLGRVA